MCYQPPGTGICDTFSHLWWGDASPQFVFPIFARVCKALKHFWGEWLGVHYEAFTKACKALITHDSYSSGWTITLPSGRHLGKGYYPKRTELYPCNPEPPVFLSDRVITLFTLLINWLRQSHVDCGCTVFLGGSPCSDLIHVILYYHKAPTLF
jgi:hypothetical protein